MFKRTCVVTDGLADSCRHDDFVYQGLDQAISEITAIHARL
jgi:hypothetical protein